MEANGVPPKPSSPPDNSDREVLVITSTSGGGNSIDHSESVVLDSRSRVRRIDIMKNAPVGGFALAYCAHRLYRRYCPRRLPVFTPFKLTELYFFWGSALTLSCYAFVSFADIIRDRDLLTIYLGGDAVAHMTAKQREEISSSSDQILFRGTRGVTFRSALESIRVGLYDTYTPFQKLNWWHHHARHDRRTWDAWAGAVVATDVKLNQRASGEVPDPLAISDLDICATPIAHWNSTRKWTIGFPSPLGCQFHSQCWLAGRGSGCCISL